MLAQRKAPRHQLAGRPCELEQTVPQRVVLQAHAHTDRDERFQSPQSANGHHIKFGQRRVLHTSLRAQITTRSRKSGKWRNKSNTCAKSCIAMVAGLCVQP